MKDIADKIAKVLETKPRIRVCSVTDEALPLLEKELREHNIHLLKIDNTIELDVLTGELSYDYQAHRYRK